MKLLLIDGYSLLFRAFFSSPPLTTKDGQPTGALYGFIKMVLRLLDEAQPEYALVAIDAAGPTFRHDAAPTYKAHRPAMPDDLASQTPLLRGLLDGLAIPHYEHSGFEADDILGTLARSGADKGIDVTIVTGDGDALQLVNDRVSTMLTRRGVSELECYTPAAVQERFGFAPELLPDYKGLRGDTSDNIPGVPGIGEKTGMSLIGKFGTLENLYEHLEEVTPPRIRELLREHREAAFASRELARIVTDLPVEIEFEACRYPAALDEAQRAKALETVRALEFKSLQTRYAPGSAPLPVAELTEQACQAQRVTDETEVFAWLDKCGWGHEAGGVALLVDEEAGLALACGEDALYFAGEAAALKSWLEDAASPKIAHDAKAARLALARQDVTLRGVTSDTLLMAYLLDPTRQHHPSVLLAEKYLGRSLPAAEEAPAKGAKKAKEPAAPASLFDLEEAPDTAEPPADPAALSDRERALAATACALQALPTVLRDELRAIGELRLFEEMELPLVDVLVAMEQCGMLLDEAQLRQIGERLEADATRLQLEIWELAGEKFNVGSTKQLQTILFDKLGLAKGRAIKTGHSTDVHTLEKLAEQHEIVRKILDYRATTKLKSTYVDALLAGLNPRTHRIHTNLNQTGAVSGRLSSSNPNLQNVPIRTAQGRLIRRAFIAPPGHVLLSADYSQIELRLLAHITGDKPLVEAFRAGEDVHARTAADLFGVPVAAVDKEMRRKAKMTNYAIAYGVSGFGLAKQLGTGSAGEAQEFINRYFAALPGVKRYIDDTLKEARANGYVETLLGRRRPLPDINTPRHQERAAAERTAINHPIQGTAADAMKIAMLAVDRELRASSLKARMMMQVHDELVFEVPEAEVPALRAMVERVMSEVPTTQMKLRVPLEVDIGVGSNWGDTKGGAAPAETVEVENMVELA